MLIDLITFEKSEKTSIDLIGANIEEAEKRNCDIFEFRGFNSEKIKRTSVAQTKKEESANTADFVRPSKPLVE